MNRNFKYEEKFISVEVINKTYKTAVGILRAS